MLTKETLPTVWMVSMMKLYIHPVVCGSVRTHIYRENFQRNKKSIILMILFRNPLSFRYNLIGCSVLAMAPAP